MRKAFAPVYVAVCAVLAAAIACAPNPADDKTEAVVEEATPEGPVRMMELVELYEIDPEASKVEWVGSKVTGSHDGGFNTIEGSIEVANGMAEGVTVDLTVDTTSIYSDTEDLTKHLSSPDFFEVETYPTATFKSTGVSAGAAEGEYSVEGNLTLHGVTKKITFPATIEVGEDEVKAQAEFFIKRNDFDIVYKGKPDDLIRDEVVIKFDIVAVPGQGEKVMMVGGPGMEEGSMDEEMMDDGDSH